METDLELKNIDDNQLKEADMVVDDENNLVDTEIQEVDGLIVDIDEEENLVATTDQKTSSTSPFLNRTMRLLATLLVLLAAIYLHLGGVQADDKNKFYYNNGYEPNIEAYVKLLEELRSQLASGTDVHEIAVTRNPANVPIDDRFIQVELENSGGEVITLIIDTENVYVVGYLFGPTSLQTLDYLDDIPREELFQAFPSPQYNHSPLGFAGNYGSLLDRERTELGHGALNDAIKNLYYSLLVILVSSTAI
ncbi:ribosome-inactivating protein [Tanacetum coccineum]